MKNEEGKRRKGGLKKKGAEGGRRSRDGEMKEGTERQMGNQGYGR